MKQELKLEQLEQLINDNTKGDISKDTVLFSGAEGGLIHYFENLLKDYTGSDFRTVVDEWLLPSLLFSSIRKSRPVFLKEILDYKPTLINYADHEGQNIFHLLAESSDYSETQPILMKSFKHKDDIQQLINSRNIYGCSPVCLAIQLKKRK